MSPVAAYPFKIDGDVLKLVADPFEANHTGLLYVFLLAITRVSMESTSRRLKNIDPTLLFEEICAESLCQFWGGRSVISDVFVIGTSNKTAKDDQGRYPALINSLSKQLQEGGGWRKGAKSPGAGDGGLDVAVWRRFYDKRPGALVGFAQCKTGDRWREHLGKNNPGSICHAYFSTPLVLTPLPIYMVPCRVSLDEWSQVMRKHTTGLLFDRCRITTFCTHLSNEIIEGCVSWVSVAIDREYEDLIAKEIISAPATRGAAS